MTDNIQMLNWAQRGPRRSLRGVVWEWLIGGCTGVVDTGIIPAYVKLAMSHTVP